MGMLRKPVTKQAMVTAAAVVVVIVGITALALPGSREPLTPVAAFLPLFAMAIFLTESLTAYLLVSQFRSTRQPFLGFVAGAYGYVAITVAVQLAVFPGVFSAEGLLGAGKQSAVWIWTFWHGGYPVLLTIAFLLRDRQIGPAPPRLTSRRGWLGIVAGPMLAIGLATLAIAGHDRLPPLIVAGSYTTLSSSWAGRLVMAANVIAILVCVGRTRLRDLLSLWLAVALLASFCDALLTLDGGARYSLGWYVARLLSVLSSTVVLGVLIWEISQLYVELQRAHDALGEKALRDGLTGARNRHYLDLQLPIELRRAARDRQSLAALMIDIDHFKACNDAHGHPAGDAVLAGVAQCVARQLRRPADFVARYGGEEFLVVLPATRLPAARQIAEAVRTEIAALRVPTVTEPLRITASIGVAALDPVPAEDAEALAARLVAAADTALYEAKRRGRDQVAVHSLDDPADRAPGQRALADG